MATKNPRVNVMLEEDLYQEIQRFAKLDRVSLSHKIKDLVRYSLEDLEDRYLSRIADKRLRTFDRKKALTHEQVLNELFPPVPSKGRRRSKKT